MGRVMDARLRRWLPVLLVALALAGAGWAAAGGAGLSGGELPPPPPDEIPTPPAASNPALATGSPVAGSGDSTGADLPAWLGWLVSAVFLTLFAGLVGLLLYFGGRYLVSERVRRREIVDQPASQPGGALTQEVRDAVRAGLADIDAGGDPRRAVIACWLRLERVAAEVGTARLAADTPTDLVTRLLAAHRVSDRALSRLAGAYRRARYAPAEVDDDLLVTARQALREIDAQLTRAGGGRDPLAVAG